MTVMRRAGSANPEAIIGETHALARLGHRLVGRPTTLNAGRAVRHLDLHVDGAGLDALERDRGYALDDEFPRVVRRNLTKIAGRNRHFQNKPSSNLWVTVEERPRGHVR